jgi:hypothetical protein
MVLAQVYFALATRDQLLRQNTRTAVYNLLAPYPPIDEVNQMLVRRYTSLIHSARYCAKLTLLAAIYDEARGRDVPDATRQERVQRYLQESADIVVVDTGTSYGMHWRLDLMSNMLMISRRDMDRWRDAAEGSPLRIAVEDATEVTLGHEGFHRFGTIVRSFACFAYTSPANASTVHGRRPLRTDQIHAHPRLRAVPREQPARSRAPRQLEQQLAPVHDAGEGQGVVRPGAARWLGGGWPMV